MVLIDIVYNVPSIDPEEDLKNKTSKQYKRCIKNEKLKVTYQKILSAIFF